MASGKIKKIAAGKSGFTLMELLIYIAILSIMTVIVADTFIMLTKGQGNIQAKSELNSNLSFSLEKIKRDVASADDLTVPFTAGSSAAELNLVIDGNTVNYSVIGGRLVRRVGVAASEYITSDRVNISQISFSRRENSNSSLTKKTVVVEISISAAYNSTSPDWQYSQSVETSVNINQDFDL